MHSINVVKWLFVNRLLLLLVLINGIVVDEGFCSFNQFRCQEGKCIPLSLVCNYEPDCENGEDELQSCQPPECETGQINCGQYVWNRTYCIPSHYRCDSIVDCVDGSDEAECTYRHCLVDDFHCGDLVNGQNRPCIPKEKHCDGYFDCRSGHDEQNCTNGGIACNLEQFRCLNGNKCIEPFLKCDHKNDCGDNSDEQGCNFPDCHIDQFRCGNALCIPNKFHCDGYQDCTDNSDEINCTNIVCPDGKFKCANQTVDSLRCLPKSKLCDGVRDCTDGSDEDIICSFTSCDSLGCEYKCQSSINGGSCYCPMGKRLASDNRTCIDRNECLEWGTCQQTCTNIELSYTCSCVKGYKLSSGNRCVTNDPEDMRLFFAQGKSIFHILPDGQDLKVFATANAPSGLDFHFEKKLIFWSDMKTKKIYVQPIIDINSKKVETYVQYEITLPGTWSPIALAVDWIGNKLYVADNIGQKIDIFELNGSWNTIVQSNLTGPVDIALDPVEGYMFIADTSRIIRSHMDGTHSKAIVSEAVYQASGVTLDLITKRVFWCDSLLDYIETVDYNGENRVLIIRGHTIPSPSRLSIFEGTIFWTDSTKQSLISIDMFNANTSMSSLYKSKDVSKDFKAIHVYHANVQIPGTRNPCGHNNGNCQQMCILTRDESSASTGYRCACKLGWQLANDLHNCSPIDEFLLYSQQRFIKGKILESASETFTDAMQPVVSRRARFVGLDFDARDEFIYFSDVLQDVIFRVHRNGTGREIVLAIQNEGVEGLSIDWAAKNLYYIDSRKGTLNVLSTRNVTYKKTLLTNLKRPRAIVVHPNRGYIYFSEWERPANISRTETDGENLIVFRNLTLGWPNGLSVDFERDRLYWCDALLDHIQHSNLDGTDVKTITSSLIRHPFSLVIFKESIFLTDWRLESIMQLNKLTGNDDKIILTESQSNRLYGLKIYSESEQVIHPNHPCYLNNGGCAKICFAVPFSPNSTEFGLVAKCACPIGEKLMIDKASCESDPETGPTVQQCPNPSDFRCNNFRCIPKSWVCDNDNDCLDNSDEEANCTSAENNKKVVCSFSEFYCNASNTCIPISFRCDGEYDCSDHSDERNCKKPTCKKNQFQCENGKCVSVADKCDGENDCGDNSDENVKHCTEKTCANFQFTCSESLYCIPRAWVCDGDEDCLNRDDEANCPTVRCSKSEFRCRNKRECIPASFRCDNVTQCYDRSDEDDCGFNLNPKCPSNLFQCKESKSCIPGSWYCDGSVDCEDKSDEPSSCNTINCNSNFYKCKNSKCIFKAYICDGKDDCGDNSDEGPEHACTRPQFRCPHDQWLCPNVTERCINLTDVCNMKPDCPNGLDEGPICDTDLCQDHMMQAGYCSHKCVQTPLGPICVCPEGETLSPESSTKCVDLNECDPPGLCSQQCTNTKGSYYCSCGPGYYLEGDKHRCKAINHTLAHLIISNRHSILISDLKERGLDRVPVVVDNVVATASNMHSGTLFWSDMKLKRIMRMDRNAQPVIIISTGLDLVEGLAYDWIAKNLYWLDSKLNAIEVSTEYGANRMVLVKENITQPRGICIDPNPRARWLFWTDWGENPRIERIGMDGNSRSTIISTKIYWPNGLTLDTVNERIYFADSKLDFIDFCYYNGTGRQQVLKGSHYLLHPHSLTLFEDTLYWTDRQLNRVLSAHKFNGKNESVVSHLISQPLSIQVNHPSLQTISPNPCDGSTCAHLCLLSPSATRGYSCKCKPGFQLSLDGKCLQKETPYLMVMRGSQIIDVSVTPTDKTTGFFTPIIGVENGLQIEYDRERQEIFWVQGKENDEENCTIYSIPYGGGNKTAVLGVDTGMVGSPYTIAFDWLGRNLFIGNKMASNLEVFKRDGNKKYHMIILSNDGKSTSVAKPRSICLDPDEGKLYWVDEGGFGVSPKIGKVNMDGTNPKIVIDDLSNPETITIDTSRKIIYFSTQFPATIQAINVDGKNKRFIVTDDNHAISYPKTLAVLDNRLYFLDPRFEKIERIDLTNPEESKILMSNENDLRSFTIFKKRLSQSSNVEKHPCLQQNNGGCEQFCIPAEYHNRVCSCSTGYKKVQDTQCVPFKSFLVISQLDLVRGFGLQENTSGEAMVPITGPGHHILHVDVHYRENWVYWVEFNRKIWNGIYRIRPNGSELQAIIQTGIGSNGIRGMAIDWIANNLYFTNVFPHENYVEVSRLDGSFRKVLVRTTTDAPRELAVNPIVKYLYWIDYGQFPRIGKAFLDGSNWIPVVTSGISVPRDLTIDMSTHDVYWVDSKLDTIQKINYDGGNRQVIRRNLANPIGIAVHFDNLYWLDRNLDTVFKSQKDSANILTQAFKIRTDLKKLRDIAVFDEFNQPEDSNNPCNEYTSNYGECKQLCFSSSALYNRAQHRCDCAVGVLSPDKSSCKNFEEFLVFATRTEIRSVSLSDVQDDKNNVPFEPIGNLTNVVGLDFDYNDNKLIFTQIRPWSRIAYIDLDSMTTKNLKQASNEFHNILTKHINPEGIAYDWTQKRIYWTDSNNNSIYSMNMNGTDIVMITRVERPRAIVIDPCNGTLYFTDWGRYGTVGKIYRTTMAGSLKHAIIDKNLSQPSGLAIDYDDRMLYWTDAVREKIERSSLNGMNREVIVTATIYPFAITVFGAHIYWTDLQLRGVYRAEKYTGANMVEIVKRLDDSPRDIHIFSRKQQQCQVNLCNINNGGCSQSCYPGPNQTAECRCNDNFKLVNDKRVCVPKNFSCDPSKFYCNNGRCISTMWSCDGEDDCGDNSDEDEKYCAFHSCSSNEFRCNNGRCIFKSWTCDHENDCKDGTDEQNCSYQPCSADEFTCENHRCLSMSQVCNGINDCKDNSTSDETHTNCPRNSTCPPSHLKCEKTNICVEPFWLCDGDNDCGDNSDEDPLHCAKRTCPSNSFRCPNHRCIPATWYCDGDDDCGDGADEPPEYCKSEGRTCFGNLFTCDNGNCIPGIYICDGDNDCLDNSDEDTRHQCSDRKCDKELEFTCEANKAWSRSQCIPRKWVCDGDPDCVDGADENSTLNNCSTLEPCNEDQFTCDNGRCINEDWVCDHDNDCGDGSDESKNCNSQYKTCSSEEFSCRNFKCIRSPYRCDGEDDCGDNSDELNCTKEAVKCPVSTDFKCNNDECIKGSLVCDKVEDCSDGSDEPLHCNVNECDKVEMNQCGHKCVDTPTGFYCECNEGYKLLADKKACMDIDECVETPEVCSQICVNTPGSYHCKCNEIFYEKTLDSHTCKRRDNATAWLLFTNKYYLRNLSIDAKQYSIIHQDLLNVVALDYDFTGNKLYFSDVTAKQIYRSDYEVVNSINNVSENEKEIVIKHDANGLEGLSVDWIGRKLYWLDRHSKNLEVAELNGTNRKTLKSGIADPRALVLHPGIGYLFFTSWHLQAYIGKIGMDGSNMTRILTWKDNIAWPNAITIDYFANRLYWADAHLDYIAFSDYEGHQRHTVISGEKVPHIFALSIFDDYVFWSDWNLKAIMRANKFNGSNVITLRNTTHRPYDLLVYHKLRQLPYENPCRENNGGCSHLCLIAPNKNQNAANVPQNIHPFLLSFALPSATLLEDELTSYQCACPNQFYLSADEKTCIANCTEGQFRCAGKDEKCIPWYWKCDGERDCHDGSDEPSSCPERKCRTNSIFQCKNFNCTPTTQICDGQDDCGDNSDEQYCDKPCPELEFKCKSNGRCILNSWKCDGDADCRDRSDEDPAICHNRTCDPETEFSCKNGKCIPLLWMCDFDNDCGDDSDEPAYMCRQRNCTNGWKRCPGEKNYRCIPNWLFCDGKDDCRDGSDELAENCVPCHPDIEFKCDNNRCVPGQWMCDYSDDCGDGSDEKDSMCKDHYRSCSESEFRCNNSKCISNRWRCDHEDDCNDESDEVGCERFQCRNGTFQCASGHCIASYFRCDGDRDCRDLSDEMNCPPRFPDGRYCAESKFQCNNKLCVSQSDLCDGMDDCFDGSDESPELCNNFNCDTIKRFQCRTNHKCISKYQVCDSVDNCGDGSDENNYTLCHNKTSTGLCNPIIEFQCSTMRKCISQIQLCDLSKDCEDGSDEIGCHHEMNCSPHDRGGCQHMCMNLTLMENNGYLCLCAPGYRVNSTNHKTCDDVDECESRSHLCSHTCTNLNGTYSCSCHDGFELSDRYTGICKLKNSVTNETGISPDQLTLLYNTGPDIRAYVFHKNEASNVIRDEKRIEALDYDIEKQMIFWADSFEKTIKRSYMPNARNGKVKTGYAQDLNMKINSKLAAIAVDWVADNLYWTEIDRSNSKPRSRIMVAKTDGRYRRAVVNTGLEMTSSIALDPQFGRMFWTDSGSAPKIESSWMDGSKRRVLLTDNIRSPTSLVIDYAMDHTLFWVDTKFNLIESMRQDGSLRNTILRGNQLKHPIALDVFESSLYWLSRDSGEILQSDKFGRGVPVTISKNLQNALDLKIYHKFRYNTTLKNPCATNECSHLCLLVPGGRRCSCPDSSMPPIRSTKEFICDAPYELARSAPEVCSCQNDGKCVRKATNSVTLTCQCEPNFSGEFCDVFVAKYRIFDDSLVAHVLLPIILILLVLAFVGMWLYVRGNTFGKGAILSNLSNGQQVVSFRQGSNVEFTNPSEQSNIAYRMDDLMPPVSQQGDFTNPMYDAMRENIDTTSIDFHNIEPVNDAKKIEPACAVIAPSSILQDKPSSNSTTLHLRKHRDLDPNIDTGKDTQKLVIEDDDEAEC